MNKIFCVPLVALIYVTPGRAQSYIGLEFTGSVSSLTGAIAAPPPAGHPVSLFDKDAQVGGGGGIWADLHLSDYLNFEPHLDFLVKGYGFQGRPSSGTGGSGNSGGPNMVPAEDGRLNLDYLTLPLDLLYRIPGEYNDFFIGAGVYGAYLLNGSYSLGSVRSDATDAGLRRYDAGWTGVLSYRWSYGLTVSASFSQGFVSVCTSAPGRAENQFGALTLGYLLHYNTKD